ncbi:hypothetical protein OROMI_016588 [Orobanche minor]
MSMVPINPANHKTASSSGGSHRFGDLIGVQWRIDLGILPSHPSASIDDLRRVTADSRRRYAALRRQLLVDPHVLKDGSRSPDLVMDNPLSQSPLQMKAYMLEVNAHTEPCRTLCFVNEDCSILATDVETGVQIARMENSHGAAVNRIVNLTESTIASGDGEVVRVVSSVRDTRQRSCCNSFSVREEYISDMTFASDSMKLIGTSGDRTLSVCNSESNKVQSRSEFSEDERLSVVIMTRYH